MVFWKRSPGSRPWDFRAEKPGLVASPATDFAGRAEGFHLDCWRAAINRYPAFSPNPEPPEQNASCP